MKITYLKHVEAHYVVYAKKWSGKVKTKWEPPEGFFTKSAEKIASGLKAAHKDLKSAMSSLNFYINRGGKNLSAEDKKRLEAAKDKLRSLYGEKEKVAATANEEFLGLDKILETYEKNLKLALKEKPKDYAWPEAELPRVLGRMREAFKKRSYSKDGYAIQKTLKELGIKNTYQAINNFIKTGKNEIVSKSFLERIEAKLITDKERAEMYKKKYSKESVKHMGYDKMKKSSYDYDEDESTPSKQEPAKKKSPFLRKFSKEQLDKFTKEKGNVVKVNFNKMEKLLNENKKEIEQIKKQVGDDPERLERIKHSFDKINQMMSELKKLQD